MGIRPDDWQVGAIPVSHSYALGNIVGPLLLQGTPVVLRDTFVPAQILDDAVRAGARLFPGVPFMFDRLVALVRDGCPWPATLETMISAGAPLDRATAQAFAEHTGRRIHSLYGTSETAGIAYDAEPRSRWRGDDGPAGARRDARLLARRRGARPAPAGSTSPGRRCRAATPPAPTTPPSSTAGSSPATWGPWAPTDGCD